MSGGDTAASIREAEASSGTRPVYIIAATTSSDQVFKAHRLFNHSTLGWRVIKKKREERPVYIIAVTTSSDQVISQKCEAVPRRARI